LPIRVLIADLLSVLAPVANRALLSPCRSDQFAELETVFKRHYEDVRALAGRRIADRATAEDIAQESFIRLLGAATNKRVTRPEAYVRQIAHHLCADYERSNGVALAPLTDVHLDPAPTPLDAQLARELRGQVHGTLRRLRPKQQKALVLWGAERRSYQQVGTALGMSHRAAEGLIARARQRFRIEFERGDPS
jgi:RNA polymerase sigma-70 factor, ECF subfamily